MKSDFFRKYIVGTSACRPRIASLRLQLEKIPCSRRKLVNLYYPENHILVGLGQISESSALLKKKKELLRLLLSLSQTISVQLTLDVFKFDNGSCL